MYQEFCGCKINLIYVSILVVFYDICHIFYEYFRIFRFLKEHESTEFGCLNDFSQLHCKAVREDFKNFNLTNFFQILSELTIYTIDLIFCIFLIRGAFKVIHALPSISLIRFKLSSLNVDAKKLDYGLDYSLTLSSHRLCTLFHAILWQRISI